MVKVEKDQVLRDLSRKNIPFVLFREPGKKARLVIQKTPLDSNRKIVISERGFYIFPFSSLERSKPLFYSPDIIYNWAEVDEHELDFEPLKAEQIKDQALFEVDEEAYVDDLTKYLDAFDKGDLKKAIYSRVKKYTLSEALNIGGFFNDLSSKYPKAFTYVAHIPGDGIWIGASPELLLSYHNQKAKTVALAGTLKINRNIPAPEWTRKEIDEHRLVERHIIKVCEELNLECVKSPVRSSSTGKVYHLKSDFSIQIDHADILGFLDKLHPTPAISGLPQEQSLELIYEVEKHERSYYCGYLGWVENKENFKLFINLRCLKLNGMQYSLFAGGGITPDSDIEKEWNETEFKMATLRDLLPKEFSLS